MKQIENEKLLDAMRHNPDNWKWIFYVNRKDPRLFVPKSNPKFGWTINFGNKYAVIGMVAIVVIIIGWSFLM